jgi:hypothetical protein
VAEDSVPKMVFDRARARIESSVYFEVSNVRPRILDCIDNPMLDGAVASSGTQIVVRPVPAAHRFTDLTAFEEWMLRTHFSAARAQRWRWTARPVRGVRRWCSRVVATAAENGLNDWPHPRTAFCGAWVRSWY